MAHEQGVQKQKGEVKPHLGTKEEAAGLTLDLQNAYCLHRFAVLRPDAKLLRKA